MRESNLYGVRVPELGDRADITVVSDAILSNEKDQSGKVENMKATISGNIIALVSEARTNKLKQYYNGLSIQFTSPANIGIGSTHRIKIDNLAEQPFTIKTALKVGDMVNATYGQSGFVDISLPMHNDSANKNGDTFTGTIKITKNNSAIELESPNNQPQYIEFKKNGQRKAYIGSPTSTDDNKFEIAGSNGAYLNIDGFASITARLAYADLGNALRLGYGQNFANISPEGNTTKTLRFFNNGVGANAYFNLESLGTLNLDTTDSNNGRSYDISFRRKGDEKGQIGATNGKIFLWNRKSNKSIDLNDNGTVSIPASNLQTNSKEVVGAINEINSSKLDKGAYQGNAQDLKDGIDGKVSKTGDTMTGNLTIKKDGEKVINLITSNNSQVGLIGVGSNSTPNDIQVFNSTCNEQMAIHGDATFTLPTKTTTEAIDANTIVPSYDKQHIIYRVESYTHVGSNFPDGAEAGALIVFRSYQSHIIQTYINADGAGMWTRTRYTNEWQSWKSIIKRINTIQFAQGTGDKNITYGGPFSATLMDIFSEKQFGDGNLAMYDSSSKNIKILKSGRYMIDTSYYANVESGVFTFKIYLNNSLIDHSEVSSYRDKITPKLVLDLHANDRLKFFIASPNSSRIYIYTANQYSRLQLTRLSEIGG